MFVILIIILVTILYLLLKFNNQYWKRRNVEGPKPSLLVGNIGQQFSGKKHMGKIITDIYNNYKDLPFVGIYRATTPCLLIRDPDFVKNIYTANFKNFAKNDVYIDQKVDPIMGRNAFFLQGDEWKKQRYVLSPCFTVGKIKAMFPLVENTAGEMVKYINKHLTEPLEMKELCTKYTLDNVACCAFGVEGRCFVEPLSQFRDLAIKFLTPNSFETFKIVLSSMIPFFAKILSLKLVRADVEDKLREIVKKSIEYREKNNIEAFFLDGYESSAVVMSHLLFELAHNPDKQGKLRQEIQQKLAQNKGVATYELMNEVAYLDACLTESLRKNAPVEMLGKICTEAYTYVPSITSRYKTKPLTIEPGTSVLIPFGGLSNDSEYFEEPDKFIPERFLVKNERETKYTFKPFGDGPRACLGQKFGQMQVKLGVLHIITNFTLTLNKKTQLPLTCDPWYFGNSPIGGLWVNFEKL